MTGKVRVVKVPECGYVVLKMGTYTGTFPLGKEVDVSKCDEDEVNVLLKQGYIEWVKMSSEADG